MTRINLLQPQELADQHLLSEYRELPRIIGLVKKSVHSKKIEEIKKKMTDKYVLGTGHVIFFYNKGEFLEKRYSSIVEELKNRKFSVQFDKLDVSIFIENGLYYNDWVPSEEEIKISLERIKEKIAMKPLFYKYSNE